jgi:hypothetical protein
MTMGWDNGSQDRGDSLGPCLSYITGVVYATDSNVVSYRLFV